MYYVSRYRGAPSYYQDTEGIIEQSILTGYTYRKYKTVLKSSLRYIMFLGVNGGASGGGGGAGGGGGSGKWLGVFSFFWLSCLNTLLV